MGVKARELHTSREVARGTARGLARVDSAGIARRLSLFLPVFAFSLQNGASKKAVMGRKVDVTFRPSQ